jgi:hypothetical protein
MDVLVNFVVSLLPTVATAFLTSYVAYLWSWKKARADLENEFLSRFNTRKWDVYTEFTKFLHKSINDNRDNPGIVTPISMDEGLISLAPQVLLAGSDKVVSAFRLWRESTQVYGLGDEATRDKLFKLVVEMRKDLGNKHTKLEIADLLGALRFDSSN